MSATDRRDLVLTRGAMEDSLHAYDWLRLAEQVREQLGIARAKLAEANGHAREDGWLAEAIDLLEQDREARERLLSSARRLPELAAIRREHAADLIGPWADALEHLHAAIVYHAGLKSPLLEALFPHRKFDALRRNNVDQAQAYGADFGRRLASSYIERLLSREEFAFAKPAVDDVAARFAALAPDGDGELDDDAKRALIEELATQARAVETAIKQARLLAEAALLPLPGAFEELGIRNKPKARSTKAPKNVEAPAPAAETAELTEPKEKPARKEKAPAKEKAAAKEKAPAKEKASKRAGGARTKRQPEASA